MVRKPIQKLSLERGKEITGSMDSSYATRLRALFFSVHKYMPEGTVRRSPGERVPCSRSFGDRFRSSDAIGVSFLRAKSVNQVPAFARGANLKRNKSERSKK
jgi:hypothetical protein